MADQPRTVKARLMRYVLIAAVVSIAVWIWFGMSGPLLWVVSTIAVITTIALVARSAWRRRTQAGLERAWVGAFSFGDVVDRMRAKEALQAAADAG